VAKFYFFPDERDVGGMGPGWENSNCSRRLFGDLVAFNHQSAKLSLRSEQLARLPLEDLLTHPRSANVSQFVFPQPVPSPTGSTLCSWKNPLPPTGREHPRFPSGSFFFSVFKNVCQHNQIVIGKDAYCYYSQ
jgi:hypothetical protein